MDIQIDRLNIQVSGISPDRAQAIGDLVGAALEAVLRARIAEFSAAPAGYAAPWIRLPTLRVSAGAADGEIAGQIAAALARALLQEMEVEG